MYKGDVYLKIPGIGSVITIWYEMFYKLRVSFDGIVSRKKVLYKSNHCIETHIDVVVEFLEVNTSVSFDLCLDD